MKRTAYLNPRSAARLVMAAACTLILAAACTTDDDPLRPDADDDDRLVPFTFTAVAPPAMTDANTRAVPGNDEWKGDGTEKIKVAMVDFVSGSTYRGTYTVISTDGKTAVLPGDEPVLWQNKEDCMVCGWSPALEPGEYNIIDQSTPEKFRKADMLWAYGQVATYNTAPVLMFHHQMVKVRVVLTGVDASATDTKVGILSPVRFKLSSHGVVNFIRDPMDYITACRDTEDAGTVAFEAMSPLTNTIRFTKQNFIRIDTGGRTYYFTPGADSPDTLESGYAYTYTVDIPSGTTSTAAAVIPGSTRNLRPQRTAAAMEGVAVEAVP